MFNLLRTDLYRLKRSRSVYIGLACILAIIALCYWFLWMMGTPGGRHMAEKIGMDVPIEETREILEGYTSITMFRDSGMDGGLYLSVLGIVAALFVCADFQSGFIKNIMPLHRDRWKYMVSKVITGGILTFCYILVDFMFCTLLNVTVLGEMEIPFSPLKDTLFYLFQAWILTAAFAALIMMLCAVLRSAAAGVFLAVVLGSGLLVVSLSSLTALFHADRWAAYTLYFNLVYAPDSYTGPGDLRGLMVGALFLVAYCGLGGLGLRKKDI